MRDGSHVVSGTVSQNKPFFSLKLFLVMAFCQSHEKETNAEMNVDILWMPVLWVC